MKVRVIISNIRYTEDLAVAISSVAILDVCHVDDEVDDGEAEEVLTMESGLGTSGHQKMSEDDKFRALPNIAMVHIMVLIINNMLLMIMINLLVMMMVWRMLTVDHSGTQRHFPECPHPPRLSRPATHLYIAVCT